MYGGNYNDVRGLICNGDFSIDMLSDAWKNYQISNKNYQNIFNTQIKGMDIAHKYDMMSGGLSAITGALSSGVGAGVLTGNPLVGIGAGAISLAGGIADQLVGEERYQQEKQIAIDQYNYQLGNIKALPDTLTNVSSYNVNNRYFPVVEYYTCSEAEVQAMMDQFLYQSYTVMAVGTASTTYSEKWSWTDFNYFKGRIIRLPDLQDDNHMANEIYNEIYKGVYI